MGRTLCESDLMVVGEESTRVLVGRSGVYAGNGSQAMMMEARAHSRVFHQGKLHGEPRILINWFRSFLEPSSSSYEIYPFSRADHTPTAFVPRYKTSMVCPGLGMPYDGNPTLCRTCPGFAPCLPDCEKQPEHFL
jgi:hypothetical protein